MLHYEIGYFNLTIIGFKMNFDKDFIMELFLDDTVSTLNKVVVAVANVVNENNENTSCFDELVIKEQSTQMMQDHIQNVKKKSEVTDVKAYFENFVVKFTEQDYIEKYQMKKTTVQVINTISISFLMSTSIFFLNFLYME